MNTEMKHNELSLDRLDEVVGGSMASQMAAISSAMGAARAKHDAAMYGANNFLNRSFISALFGIAGHGSFAAGSATALGIGF